MKAAFLSGFLPLIFVTVTLSGCRLEVVDEEDSVDDPIVEVELQAFASGNEPTQGMMGSKQIRVLNNEPEFLEVWPQYMPKSLPVIDFSEHSVLLFDRGRLDRNACIVQKNVTSVTSFRLDENTLQIDINWQNTCPEKDQLCRTEVDLARPFAFYQLEKAENVLIAEFYDEKSCD